MHHHRPLLLSLLVALGVSLGGCDGDETPDGGPAPDAGGRTDAGPRADAGGPTDAGPTSDAGSADGGADGGAGPEIDVRAVGSAFADIGRAAVGTRGGQLSGDGSCFVFDGEAEGVSRGGDIGRQVYLLDVETDAIELVSVDDTGAPAASPGAELPLSEDGVYVSDDCRYVVFSAAAPMSSAPGDDASYPGSRVYLRDRTEGTTELLSFLPGAGITSGCDLASMSAAGDRVLFRCHIEGRNNSFTNPRELYLWSRGEGAARYLDVKRDGGADLTQPFDTAAAFLAPNGRFVISQVPGERLGLGDGSTWIRIDSADDSWVELALQDPGVTERLSFPVIAVDGDATELLYVTTSAVLAGTDPAGAHLYRLDVEAGTRSILTGDPTARASADHVRLSRDGRYATLQIDDLAFAGVESNDSVVRWDREAGEWTVLSRWLRNPPSGGVVGDPHRAFGPSISADGTTVIFRCFAESAANGPPARWVELCRWRAP